MSTLMKNPSLQYFANMSGDASCFSMEDAVGAALNCAGFEWSDKKDSIEEYYQTILFPHCLRLCLMLAGEQNKVAGTNEQNELSPIPDPFLPLGCHSEAAMSHAYSILRRARLMKAIRFIVGGGIPFATLRDFLFGPMLRKQTAGVPVWWCPWIHDLGLLVHAAFYGLESAVTQLPTLQRPFVQRHVREVFVEGTNEKKPVLPRSFLDHASKEEIDAWVDVHSVQFPTPNVIERRLALLCSRLTRNTSAHYDDVPMFDGGGWPTAKESNTFGGDDIK
jgi:hypothetical protein